MDCCFGSLPYKYTEVSSIRYTCTLAHFCPTCKHLRIHFAEIDLISKSTWTNMIDAFIWYIQCLRFSLIFTEVDTGTGLSNLSRSHTTDIFRQRCIKHIFVNLFTSQHLSNIYWWFNIPILQFSQFWSPSFFLTFVMQLWFDFLTWKFTLAHLITYFPL